ncbi:MAG: hypothetical protein JSW40_00765 [Candidatus Omnitrophota bacterium]|nr:MAG: hypothetical protein JSW40_00765 [Candidatus Omnitrophota bacterium]
MKRVKICDMLELMERKSVALIFGILVVVVIIILAAAILSRSISEQRLADRVHRARQAFWLAEAGIEDAQSELNADQFLWNLSSYNSGDTSLGEGLYNYTISDQDESGNTLSLTRRRVTSMGIVENMPRQIQAIIAWEPEDFLDYAVSGRTLIELKNGTTIHGDVYVDGNVEVKLGASVVKIDDSIAPPDPAAYDANVYYTGLNLGVAGLVEGAVLPTAFAPPPVTFNWPDLKANADFVRPTGWTPPSGVLADGVYYVEGDAQLDNITLNEGAIVAEGKIEIINGFTHGAPVGGYPSLATQTGIIEISGAATVYGLIYTNALGIELKTVGSNLTVYGAVTSQNDVEIKSALGGVNIYYKPEYFSGFSGEAQVSSWQDISEGQYPRY